MTRVCEEGHRPPEGGNFLRRLASFWQGLRKPFDSVPRRDEPKDSGAGALPIGSASQEPLDAWLLWVLRSVRPALNRLAKSGLRDISPLMRLTRTLPEQEREPWREVVLQVAELRQTLCRNPNALLGRVFVRLVKHLNAVWFIPRRLLIACIPRGGSPARPEDMTEWFRLEFCSLHEDQRLAFLDGEVRVLTVSQVFPPLFGGGKFDGHHKNYFDPTSGWVRIDLEFWRHQVLHELFLRDERYRPNRSPQGRRDASLPLVIDFVKAMSTLFPSPFDLYQAHLGLTWCEEVRHAIDSQRVLRDDPDATLTGDYSLRTLEILLPPGGRLHREVCEPTDFLPPDDLGAAQRQTRTANTIREISGQLTAAAVGPSPLSSLLFWELTISTTLSEYPQGSSPRDAKLDEPGVATARIAVALLAEQMGLSPTLSLRAADRPDFERLLTLAKALYQRHPRELRLALKTIYQREFVHNRIDEPPFGEIGSGGEYIPRSRPSETAAGAPSAARSEVIG